MIPNAMDGKRKRNGRFISTKSKRKRVSLTEYEKKAITTGKSGEKERDSAGWRDGRRIVELGFLVDQLSEGCSECKTKFNLTNIVDETLQLRKTRASCTDPW